VAPGPGTARSSWRSSAGRLGAVSFVHRFGAALNAYLHFHCCVIDGVLVAGEDGELRFAEATLTPEDMAAVQQQVRARVAA